MSIKTIRKRVALVAISALTAGAFSVVSAPVANAGAVVAHEANTLILSNISSVSGSATVFANGAATDLNTMRSVGWITDTSSTVSATDGGNFVNGSATKTANVYPGAVIAFLAKGSISSTGNGTTIKVTGGTLSSLGATGGGAVSGTASGNNHGAAAVTLTNAMVSTDMTTIVIDNDTAETIFGLFTVSAAVGSTATISLYDGDGITGLSTATAGTYQGGYVLTVASSSAVGTYSAAESSVYQQACLANATTGTSGSVSYDVTSRCATGTAGVIWVDLEDTYGSPLTSGTLTGTASAGTIIGSLTTSTGAAINSATDAFSTLTVDADGDAWFYVKQPVANTAGSSTVTITYNGVVIGTKTINWAGTPTSLSVDTANSCTIFSTNQLTNTQEGNIGDACVVYVAKDAAGNNVTLTAQPSISAATGALIGTTTSTLTASSGYAVVQSSSLGYGTTTLLIPNNSLSGASTYQLELTNGLLQTIKSQVVNVTVSRGATNSFKASWDKAAYNYGDIATLTIELKDAYGNLMGDGTPLTGLDLTVNTGGFTATGTACTAASTTSKGVRTCKYSALNTEGAYAFSVDLTTATAQDPTIGTIPVKPSTAAVSNADVLKSIVALIASINKQIQALQKLLLKR